MTNQVPRLLISVRDEAEACDALSGGADVIDVKEPARGPLGAADVDTIATITSTVAGRRPVSVALGELVDGWSGTLPGAVAYAKVGLARSGRGWREELAACFDQVRPVMPIAVAYADHKRAVSPPAGRVLDWAVGYGVAGVLIDTAVKDDSGLFDWLSEQALSGLIAAAHQAKIPIALAGSLRGDSLNRAISLGPDIVAVRGAACAGNDRQSRIDRGRVGDLASLVAAHTSPAAVPVD